jgi:hypothetical protein
MSKQTNKLFLILSKVFCLCFLFALISANVAFSHKSNEANNLVYCPLQKTWVKKTIEILPIRKTSLEQLCMSDAEKQNLAIQLSLKNALAIDEKGIFETLKFGVKVLGNYRKFPNLPNQNSAELQQSFAVINGKNDLQTDFQINSQAFSFQQLSRPPTITETTKFDFSIAQSLDKISRNINPRSPPMFS